MKKLIIALIFSILYGNNQIPGTEQKRPILLRGGTLHTVTGDVLEEYDLLFAEGKIITIDEQIQPSPETDVIDIYGKHVIPGFYCWLYKNRSHRNFSGKTNKRPLRNRRNQSKCKGKGSI